MMKCPWVLAWVLISLYTSAFAGEPAIEISDAWIREAPPGAAALAGFMVLRNTGKEALTIGSFSSAHFARIEIHRSVVHEGIAHMLHKKHLVVGAGKTVVLEPGGYHLMLLDPPLQPYEGEQIPITVHIANHEPISVVAPVRKATAADVAPAHKPDH